ncbi:hypothetical protein JCM8547_003666 [Rhodosporidiobolus lusitaniae]
MAHTDRPMRVALAGGGLAGLSCALALEKKRREGANIEVHVYEQAAKFAEIGAGVSLGPNAQTSLRLMGLGDVLESVAAPSDDPNLWFDFRVGDDGQDTGKQFAKVTGKNAGTGNVFRAALLDGFISKLPADRSSFNHRVRSYSPHAEGVTLHFEQEGVPDAEADVLIASDGIKSVLRKHLYQRKGEDLSKQAAKYSKWVAWRGMIPREKYEEAFGKEASDKIMHFGHGRHILTFPVKKGETINIVAFVRDENDEKLGDHTAPWAEPRPKEELMADFASFNKDCKKLLEAIDSPSIWGIWDLRSIEYAVDERTVLIGDAAHGTTPHQGAGAGQAIEDSLFLAELIAHPSVANSLPATRGVAIERALRLYQTERHPRAQKVQTTSYEAGKLYEFLDPSAGSDLDKIKKNLEERMSWIWSFDVEKELQRVVGLLEKEEA